MRDVRSGMGPLFQARRLLEEVAEAVGSVWLHNRVPEFYLKAGASSRSA